MADPSKERIAAALALAEAVHVTTAGGHLWPARVMATEILSAARAFAETAPKLRTRAEVDAERLLNLDAWRRNAIDEPTLRFRDERLAREETAPEQEPPPSKECDWCQDSSRPPLHRNRTPERLEWVCRRCLEERWKPGEPELQDPPPCGCEETEALRKQLQRIRSLSINYPCNGETGALVAIRHCIDFGEP